MNENNGTMLLDVQKFTLNENLTPRILEWSCEITLIFLGNFIFLQKIDNYIFVEITKTLK